MKATIFKLPLADLPGEGPTLVIAPLDAGTTPTARYLQYANSSGTLPEGKPLVAIIRSPPLSTSDELKVMEIAKETWTTKVSLEMRCYTGALFANVMTIALVEVELGSLTKGQYEMLAILTRLDFQDINHPENAINPTTSQHQILFNVG